MSEFNKWRKGAPGLASRLGEMKTQLEELQVAARQHQSELAAQMFKVLENAEVLAEIRKLEEEMQRKKEDG